MGKEAASGRKSLALSAAAASCAETATFPLDLIKTRMQLNQARVPQTILKTVSSIIRQEGLLTLYNGLPAAVLRHIPYSSIRVATFENLRNWSLSKQKLGSNSVPLPSLMVFGMVAGGLGQTVAVPFDLLKIRLQTPGLHQRGILDAFGHIVRQEGVFGLWRGSFPAIQRAALVNLGELSTYDSAKRFILKSGMTAEDTASTHVLSSMCSGLVSALVSTPADVVKTRLMSQDPLKPQFSGMIDCFQKTLLAEGVRGLYKGFLPTWARLGPWQLAFWVVYEQLRKLQGLEGF